MKHFVILLLSLACLTRMSAQQSILQDVNGTFYGAAIDTDGSGRTMGQTFDFPGGRLDTIWLAAYSHFSLIDHTGTLSIMRNNDTLWTSHVVFPGLGKFFPDSVLQGVTDVETSLLWLDVDVKAANGQLTLDSMLTAYDVGYEFSPGSLALVIELDDYVDPGSTHQPFLYVRGNCFSPFCGANTILDPYADGAALNGIPLGPLTDADLVFKVTYAQGLPVIGHEAPQELMLYPNPATDKVTIAAGDYDNYEIFDLLGQSWRTGTFQGTEKATVTIDDLPTGSYIVRVSSGSSEMVGRLVVQ